MFAIINIAGQQYKVSKDDTLFVHRLSGNVGDKIELSEILLTSKDGKTSFSNSGMKATAEILEHLKGEKVLIFKKKRRKGYQKLNGHRQSLTKIKISDLA